MRPKSPPYADPDIPDLWGFQTTPIAVRIPPNGGTMARGWPLNGIYAGELVQDPVLLYESHLRLQIQGRTWSACQSYFIPTKSGDRLLLCQVEDGPDPNEGWGPMPLLNRFQLVTGKASNS